MDIQKEWSTQSETLGELSPPNQLSEPEERIASYQIAAPYSTTKEADFTGNVLC